jgi:hypothetical protein
MPVFKYIKALLGLAAKHAWNNANGLAGALLSGLATLLRPLTIFGGSGVWSAANYVVTFVVYALIAYAALFAFQVIFVAPFYLWLRDRREADGGLEFIFDTSNAKYVRDEVDDLGGIKSRFWFVGVRNSSSVKSIDDISLRANEGDFVGVTVAEAHARPDRSVEREPVLRVWRTLPPRAEELVPLFGLDPNVGSNFQDALGKANRFTLELRGRDTPTVWAAFEYQPTTPPTITRLP